MSSADREYDPEIKDIADYVANKTIDSELAVSAINSAEASILHPAKNPGHRSPAKRQMKCSQKKLFRSQSTYFD